MLPKTCGAIASIGSPHTINSTLFCSFFVDFKKVKTSYSNHIKPLKWSLFLTTSIEALSSIGTRQLKPHHSIRHTYFNAVCSFQCSCGTKVRSVFNHQLEILTLNGYLKIKVCHIAGFPILGNNRARALFHNKVLGELYYVHGVNTEEGSWSGVNTEEESWRAWREGWQEGWQEWLRPASAARQICPTKGSTLQKPVLLPKIK